MPAPTDAPIADPFISLTAMASATEKIRLGTGICLVPEHNPVVLAKVVATLDWLSNGRVMLGVGIGWLEEEFQAHRDSMGAARGAHPRMYQRDAQIVGRSGQLISAVSS